MANKDGKQAIESLGEYLEAILDVTGCITDMTDPIVYALFVQNSDNEVITK